MCAAAHVVGNVFWCGVAKIAVTAGQVRLSAGLRTRANFRLEFEFESGTMSSQYAYPGMHTYSCSAGALMSTDRSR